MKRGYLITASQLSVVLLNNNTMNFFAHFSNLIWTAADRSLETYHVFFWLIVRHVKVKKKRSCKKSKCPQVSIHFWYISNICFETSTITFLFVFWSQYLSLFVLLSTILVFSKWRLPNCQLAKAVCMWWLNDSQMNF